MDPNSLVQTSSCYFSKVYLNLFGLYIGGYIAWIILGLAGASKSPVWSPKNKMNKPDKKKLKEEKKRDAKLKKDLMEESTPDGKE